jgi:hypothetical protein
MKYLLYSFIALALVILSGCASLTYEAADGSRVTYTRFLTGSDSIKGKLPGASIESKGQKAIDPETLQSILQLFGAK